MTAGDLSINGRIFLVLIAALIGWAGAGVINALADRLIRRYEPVECEQHHQPIWPTLILWPSRGWRCPTCGERLFARPPLVELITPLLFALAVIRFGVTVRAVVVACYLAVLLLITVVDLATRRIPNVVVLPAAAAALILAALGVYPGLRRSLVGGAIALGIFLLAYALGGLFLRVIGGRAASSGPALGAGDVKLALFIGLSTGYPTIIPALFFGTLSGAIAAIGWIVIRLVQRRYRPFAAMAYGPYLATGAAIALLWGEQLIVR